MSRNEIDPNNVNLRDYCQNLFFDLLCNIVHAQIRDVHHKHKLMIANLDPVTRLPHCENCNLPRLLEPPLAAKVRGAAADPPASTTYCDKRPWSRKPLHDIYGNPFLKSDVTGRPITKKEQKKNGADADADGEDDGDDGGGGGGAKEKDDAGRKLEKGEKKASKIDEKLKKGEYIPWHTCPSCKRSLLITRFAKHLEGCMGLNGRAASRNAMAKMKEGATNGSETGSRSGTPGARDKDRDADGAEEDEEDDLPGGSTPSVKKNADGGSGGAALKKKLLKKGLKDKAKKEGVGDGESGSGGKLKIPKSLSKSRDLRSSPAPSSAGGDGKRDRDGDDGADDEDEVRVKKRQKLQRVGSTVSLASHGTDMERSGSNDGSYDE